MSHPSTPAERLSMIGQLVAARGHYGVVTALSRTSDVSRQTLSAWRERGCAALMTMWDPPDDAVPTGDVRRAILTLLVEGHASLRGIQACLRELWGRRISLGTIQGVVAEAGRRAIARLQNEVGSASSTLALDELFAGDARAAYLSAVDGATGAVWATAGPVPPDAESWTLLLWDLQARGGRWAATRHDGGHAAAAGAAVVDPTAPCGRDLWHVLNRLRQTQHRLEVRLTEATHKLEIRGRYEATVQAGNPWIGQPPRSSAAAQAGVVAEAHRLVEAVGFLGQEVRRALDVVVVVRDQVLAPEQRRAELAAALTLLAEVAVDVADPVRTDLRRLHTHLTQALPGLLTCAESLAPVEASAATILGSDGLGLVGWAWQHRASLGWTVDELLAAMPPTWRPIAQRVLHAWTAAVRTTSLAESWHALVRVHVVVHRGLSPGLLALLAVWHNHRVVPRGIYAGTSPLQRSGFTDPPTDWLTALGYPPANNNTPEPTPITRWRQEAAA